ncbi:13598_t:CDS:2 [Cetraspora pellucida]|uniref:13598_t:CDS:1 n=1 Tax=Cetraspora pellucida TaxID=1433469 RepID=A0A9N9DJE4_9GLOM|nr:13598_t:CDS:2 [Cetraspora pellucida]
MRLVRFNVIFNTKANCDKHFEWLKSQYNRIIGKSTQSILSVEDKNYVNEFSIDNVRGYTGFFTHDFANKLLKRDEVDIVEEDSIVHISHVVPRKIQNNVISNLDRIDQANSVLNEKYLFPDSAGEGVNVFIVDTGIRKDHIEFEGRAKSGGTFCAKCEGDDDLNGHGTSVAGIVGGKTFGVAKKVTLIAVKALNDSGSASNSEIVNALTFILETHKKSKNKNSVVNMSLGGKKSRVINKTVKKLTDAGIHVVVAAGNEADDACKSSPSSELSAITVGAINIDRRDTKKNQIALFSNFGKCVDIFAPGIFIVAAGSISKSDISAFTGTSQATPHVAGTIALIIAKDGNKSAKKMATTLKDLSIKNAIDFLGNKTIAKGTPNNLLRVPAP